MRICILQLTTKAQENCTNVINDENTWEFTKTFSMNRLVLTVMLTANIIRKHVSDKNWLI